MLPFKIQINLGEMCQTAATAVKYYSRTLFELFSKAVMSGGFSVVLEKASYFELSCVTVVFFKLSAVWTS